MLEEANQLNCSLTYCSWLENSDTLHFSNFLKEKIFRSWFDTNTYLRLTWYFLFWLELNEIFTLSEIEVKLGME